MSKNQLNHFQYRGARACILMHEETIKQFVETWKQAKAKHIELPKGRFSQYESYEALLVHVVDLARKYLIWICQSLELPDPEIKPCPKLDRIELEIDTYLEHLFKQYRLPLANVPGNNFYKKGFLAPWGVEYCIDAMLEHAVMHPCRHKFQLLELMEE